MLNSQRTQLKAGAAIVEITPALDVGLLASSVRGEWVPFRSKRTPLHARALVLERGQQKVGLLSLDLLGLASGAVGHWSRFKRAVARGTLGRFTAEQIVITCTHTHNGPESVGITGLHRTAEFQAWLEDLQKRLAQALLGAETGARDCTLAVATTELAGFSLNRRIPTAAGIVMSDSLQPIAPELLLRKPIDRRVRTLQFSRRDGSSIATVVHAICHPVHEMCLPHISWDFPGEMCRALEERPGLGTALFLNGAAGDVNPTTVSEGAKASTRHGRALAEAVIRSLAQKQPVQTEQLQLRRRTLPLPVRSSQGRPISRTCPAHLSVLQLGELALVFVPGEIFSQTGLAIEEASPFRETMVVGFAESSIGYVPPRQMFQEGGYEIGPGKWSFLQRHAEPMLRKEIHRLLKSRG